jgi:hypothetical protein
MLSLISAWLGWDYSSEAEVADKDTLLYCAVSNLVTVDDTVLFRCKITCFIKKHLNRLYLMKIIDIL